MARVINIYEAKSRLSALVEEAAAGREVVIAKAGVPRARLVPMARVKRRKPGTEKGRIRVSRDFDAPLPAAVLALFTGE